MSQKAERQRVRVAERQQQAAACRRKQQRVARRQRVRVENAVRSSKRTTSELTENLFNGKMVNEKFSDVKKVKRRGKSFKTESVRGSKMT